MRGRWLLLAVSVLCLLVLFPARALSQRAELQGTCGSARVDGVKSPGEWNDAGVVRMFAWGLLDSMIADLGLEGSDWDVSLAQPATVTARLYAMNDESHLYLAQLINLDSAVADPKNWFGEAILTFMDEPDALDGDFEADDCDPLPSEGAYALVESRQGTTHVTQEFFMPLYQGPAGPVNCAPVMSTPGVNWAMGPGSLFVEWEIDLNASEIDKVGAGDCLLASDYLIAQVCPQGADCTNMTNWVAGYATWPEQSANVPLTTGMVCLDPCEVEFVPEPGTVMLLGSGLAGLAGYATLRWRSRK